MDITKYCVVFKGEIVEGADIEEVKKQVSLIFKISPEKTEKMFSGEPNYVKKDVNLQTAEKFKKAFEKAGAVTSIESVEDNTAKEHAKMQLEGKMNLVVNVVSAEKLNRKKLLLLTLCLGGFGAHHYYLRRNFLGNISLLFCWTAIPFVVSLIEFVIYFRTPIEKLDTKYKVSSGWIKITITSLIGFLMILGEIVFCLGVLLPQMIVIRNRDYQKDVIYELNYFWVAQEIFFSDNNRYALIEELNDYRVSHPTVKIELIKITPSCFTAKGSHKGLYKFITINCDGNLEGRFAPDETSFERVTAKLDTRLQKFKKYFKKPETLNR